MTVAGVVARTEFQAKLFESLTAAGVKIEQVVGIYQPLSARDHIECLIVDMEQGPLTVWCDPQGKITKGPWEGFRDPPDAED
jgi:hypothetical protein